MRDQSPTVAVIGEVVGLRSKLNWFEKRPFFGKRLVVTRSREQAGQLSAKLKELGATCSRFRPSGWKRPTSRRGAG
jgi:uroporphyrinogen III methyltransferase/synthase